jgi:hypothetical protein
MASDKRPINLDDIETAAKRAATAGVPCVITPEQALIIVAELRKLAALRDLIARPSIDAPRKRDLRRILDGGAA